MKVFTLNRINQEPIKIFIPESLSEIKIKDLVDYETRFETLPDWFKNFDGNVSSLSRNQQAQFIRISVEMLGKYTGVAIEILNELKDVATLVTLWQSLDRTIRGYEPSERDGFKYKGMDFVIPKTSINELTGNSENPNLSTIEVIAALQYEHLLNEPSLVAKGRNYDRYLALCAILVRKKGEDLSKLDDDSLVKFTAKRMIFFKDLPSDIVLDVLFFFTNSLTTSKRTAFAGLCLKVLSEKAKARHRM